VVDLSVSEKNWHQQTCDAVFFLEKANQKRIHKRQEEKEEEQEEQGRQAICLELWNCELVEVSPF